MVIPSETGKFQFNPKTVRVKLCFQHLDFLALFQFAEAIKR